jgi:hypothetical protein
VTLHALILAVAALVGRGTPPAPVVDAIDTACTEEAARAPVDPEACAALMTVYGARESSWRAVYGDHGRSYGYWQEPAAIARQLDALGQARYWLRVLRESSLASVDSSPARARVRLALSRRLLGEVLVGVAERMP